MDTKLATNLEDLEALFSTRMAVYEEKLAKATTSSSTATNSASDLTSLLHEFQDFKTFVMLALSKLKSQVEVLALGFDRHETAMRRKVLLIHGVPELKDEKPNDVVLKVLNHQMKLTEVGKDSIHICHRLGSLKQGSRPILVRFFSMEHRHLVWDNKKSLKGTGVTVSEFLTQMRHRTFVAARKRFGMTNCWSIEGKIVIIAPDNSRHKIESSEELLKLSARFSQSSANIEVSAHSEDHAAPITPSAVTITPAKAVRKTRRRN